MIATVLVCSQVKSEYEMCSYYVAKMMTVGSLTVEYPTGYWKIWVRFPSHTYDSLYLVFRAKQSMSSGYIRDEHVDIQLWISEMNIDNAVCLLYRI